MPINTPRLSALGSMLGVMQTGRELGNAVPILEQLKQRQMEREKMELEKQLQQAKIQDYQSQAADRGLKERTEAETQATLASMPQLYQPQSDDPAEMEKFMKSLQVRESALMAAGYSEQANKERDSIADSMAKLRPEGTGTAEEAETQSQKDARADAAAKDRAITNQLEGMGKQEGITPVNNQDLKAAKQWMNRKGYTGGFLGWGDSDVGNAELAKEAKSIQQMYKAQQKHITSDQAHQLAFDSLAAGTKKAAPDDGQGLGVNSLGEVVEKPTNRKIDASGAEDSSWFGWGK